MRKKEKAQPIPYIRISQALSERRDLNPRHPPWQGGALPLSYFRIQASHTIVLLREAGLEPANSTTLAMGLEPQRDRTFDPQIKSLLLYQLS